MNVHTKPDSVPDDRGVAELLAAAQQAHLSRDRGRAADLMATAIARHERTGEAMPANLYQDVGILLYELERFEEAIEWLRKGIAKRPKAALMVNALGASLRRLGREAEAIEAFDTAIKLDKANPSPLLNKSRILIDRQDIAGAMALLTRALKINAKLPDGQLLMGLAYRARGDFEQALRRMDASLQLDPRGAAAWTEKIATLRSMSRIDEAVASADQAIAKLGELVSLVEAKTNALNQGGRVAEAIEWIGGLIARKPERAWLHMLMARLVAPTDRERANVHFREALSLKPDDPAALIELAYNLDMTRGPLEARNINESYELAKRFVQAGRRSTGQTRRAHSILHRSADYDAAEALGTFEDLGQRWASAGQIAAMHLHLAQARKPSHRRMLVEWHRLAARPLSIQAAKAPLPPRAPAIRRAKIRIGFMSSDLRDHPVTYFTLPIIEGYDRDRFELHCYSWSTHQPDKIHQFIAGRVDRFHHVPIIASRAAAELIQGDQLDILFELGGTTAMNKIEVMAWRPAPRQASWLGYPHSIGLEEIDRILVDPYLNPPDPALLVEKPFMLAHSWVTLGRLGFRDDHVIEPGTAEERRGHLTFGTANNPYKYSREVIRTWAEILKRVDKSRFMFVRPECGAESFRANIRRHFATFGVDPERIEFVAIRGKHMPHYNAIDIALDTFPHVGGTTTCESLWMGVPTVTLIGEAFFERMSYSNVTNAGLGDLAAVDLAGYIDVAVGLAGDPARRAELRRTIRERIRSHPLGQASVFVRDFMDAAARWMDEAK